MVAKTLPIAVRNAVRMLTCFLGAMVILAAVAWDTDSLIVSLTLAVMSTGALGFLYLAEKIDALMTMQRKSEHERQLMTIGLLEQMACGPVTDPEGKRQATGLRVVSG
jgi:hypothetical protein